MTYRMRNILIAVALAGFAALLVTLYVSNYKSSVQHGQEKISVPVAAHAIPAGTLGTDVISKGWLTTKQIPHDDVVPGAVASADQIKGLVAIQATYAGEQITTSRFGPRVQQGIPGQISATQRAVQIAGDPNQTLANVLQPGDSVDFEGVLDVAFGANQSFPFSRIVVRNLKVLGTEAVGAPTPKLNGGATGGSQSAVLLRMTDQQSQKIMLIVAAAKASNSAYWTLELRPGLKSQDSPNGVETPFTILTDGIAPATLRAALGIAVIAQATGGH